MQAMAWIFVETSPDQTLNRRRSCRRQLLPFGIAPQHLGSELTCRRAFEGRPSREHFKEHAAERPDIGSAICSLTLQLFRRHVRGRSEENARGGLRSHFGLLSI